MSDLDDDALAVFQLRAPGGFPHLAHVRVARLYLQRHSLGEVASEAARRDFVFPGRSG